MKHKILAGVIALMPLIVFAEPNSNAFEHASSTGREHGHAFAAPEIDGNSLILSIALLGGIISLIARNKKK